ncbi:sugar transferase [Arachidicoccus sp.]|uniref:sugar transferase n=1 Tax=Arachidicoccus sp. TaxID=1872624 RepID=UPI003D1FDFCA
MNNLQKNKALKPLTSEGEEQTPQTNWVLDNSVLTKQQTNLSLTYNNQTHAIANMPFPLKGVFSRFIKRSFDIALSVIVIISIMSWLVPLLSLLIKLESKGSVFFVQYRSGKNGVPFKCYKFRSMYINNQADTLQACMDDIRFTKIGRFIRRRSIDELPQFFNVLKNDMSVIGPRPHMLMHTEKYKRLLNDYMVRHFIKPGITGWAQVSGFRGETKKLEEMGKRIQHDVFYLENWSFLFDIRITFKTIWILLKKDKKAY